MTKGQLKFAAVIAWLVMTGGGIYLGLIYINPIVVWIIGVMGCPAALLLMLQKIDPDGYSDSDDDYETRSRKNDDDEDDIFITPPPLTIGYGVWNVSDDD